VTSATHSALDRRQLSTRKGKGQRAKEKGRLTAYLTNQRAGGKEGSPSSRTANRPPGLRCLLASCQARAFPALPALPPWPSRPAPSPHLNTPASTCAHVCLASRNAARYIGKGGGEERPGDALERLESVGHVADGTAHVLTRAHAPFVSPCLLALGALARARLRATGEQRGAGRESKGAGRESNSQGHGCRIKELPCRQRRGEVLRVSLCHPRHRDPLITLRHHAALSLRYSARRSGPLPPPASCSVSLRRN
jgi:hypothetical protein